MAKALYAGRGPKSRSSRPNQTPSSCRGGSGEPELAGVPGGQPLHHRPDEVAGLNLLLGGSEVGGRRQEGPALGHPQRRVTGPLSLRERVLFLGGVGELGVVLVRRVRIAVEGPDVGVADDVVGEHQGLEGARLCDPGQHDERRFRAGVLDAERGRLHERGVGVAGAAGGVDVGLVGELERLGAGQGEAAGVAVGVPQVPGQGQRGVGHRPLGRGREHIEDGETVGTQCAGDPVVVRGVVRTGRGLGGRPGLPVTDPPRPHVPQRSGEFVEPGGRHERGRPDVDAEGVVGRTCARDGAADGKAGERAGHIVVGVDAVVARRKVGRERDGGGPAACGDGRAAGGDPLAVVVGDGVVNGVRARGTGVEGQAQASGLADAVTGDGGRAQSGAAGQGTQDQMIQRQDIHDSVVKDRRFDDS
ncbi:hypothetical protein [Streptomyces chartreusis]|uniref:hypothetical protein n=1 Tax=Streptomyces chartreusis TaxID=1969 RepID=UPI0036548285